eukprot:3155496-Rhodomonas_salina.1
MRVSNTSSFVGKLERTWPKESSSTASASTAASMWCGGIKRNIGSEATMLPAGAGKSEHVMST